MDWMGANKLLLILTRQKLLFVDGSTTQLSGIHCV